MLSLVSGMLSDVVWESDGRFTNGLSCCNCRNTEKNLRFILNNYQKSIGLGFSNKKKGHSHSDFRCFLQAHRRHN